MVTYSLGMDAVFKALADPTRRSLLDELFKQDGQTLSALEQRLPMTRFGVMKHLKVLEQAGLVTTKRRGREKLHFLNPVPIRLVHDRWVSKYSEPWAATLSGLKTTNRGGTEDGHGHAEQRKATLDGRADGEGVRDLHPHDARASVGGDHRSRAEAQVQLRRRSRLRLEDGLALRAHTAGRGHVSPRERTWRSIHRGGSSRASPRCGARRSSTKGPRRVTWEIEPVGDSCRLTVTHDQLREDANGEIYGGWPMILSGLKTLLETGELLTTPGSLRYVQAPESVA